MRPKLIVVLTAAILGCVAAGAAAAPVLTVYTDRASWEAAVTGFSEQDFNSFLVTTPYDMASVDVGDFSVSVAGETFGSSWHNLGPATTPNDVSGTPQLTASTGSTGGTTLSFDVPIVAFGAYWDGVSDDRTTSINVGGTIVAIPNIEGGGFWGFTSDTAFSSPLLVLTAGAADGFALDNVVYSSAQVPEPALLALLGLGLTAVRMRRRD